MPWGRLVFLSIITVTTLALIVIMIFFRPSLEGRQAPGISAADAASLSAPYSDLMANRDDALVASFAEGIDRNAARTALPKMRALTSDGSPTSSTLLSYSFMNSTGGSTLSGVHEYQYPDRVVRATTTLLKSKTGWRLYSLNVNSITRAEVAANKFSLSGRSTGFIAFVVATVALPIFVLTTLWNAMLSKTQTRPWLWALFILVGFMTFRMNGATGQIAFQPLSFQLLSSSATWSGSAFDPWIFGLSIPLGALVYWGRRLGASKP